MSTNIIKRVPPASDAGDDHGLFLIEGDGLYRVVMRVGAGPGRPVHQVVFMQSPVLAECEGLVAAWERHMEKDGPPPVPVPVGKVVDSTYFPSFNQYSPCCMEEVVSVGWGMWSTFHSESAAHCTACGEGYFIDHDGQVMEGQWDKISLLAMVVIGSKPTWRDQYCQGCQGTAWRHCHGGYHKSKKEEIYRHELNFRGVESPFRLIACDDQDCLEKAWGKASKNNHAASLLNLHREVRPFELAVSDWLTGNKWLPEHDYELHEAKRIIKHE